MQGENFVLPLNYFPIFRGHTYFLIVSDEKKQLNNCHNFVSVENFILLRSYFRV